MKVELSVIGKTNEEYLNRGIQLYLDRLKHYLNFSMQIIPNLRKVKNLTPEQIKTKEAEQIFKSIRGDDYVVLLDERGEELSSEQFSIFMERALQSSKRRVVFLIGGAYGTHEKIKHRSDYTLSLSKMTFSHQLIRLIFIEQLYRAMTILRNEPYHNK